jgi:hypothetical protein
MLTRALTGVLLIGDVMTATPGYRFHDADLPISPVSLDDLALLQRTLLWTDDDTAALRRVAAVLGPQVEAVLDVWYGFVGSNPHLVSTFAGADGTPDAAYLAAVRARFARWIVDTCTAPRDQDWLDWQHEIAVRHHVTGKNRTDGVASTSAEVPMRYLVAFVVPLTVTVRDFLQAGAADQADLEAMYGAWFKVVTLTATLWCRPYAPGW